MKDKAKTALFSVTKVVVGSLHNNQALGTMTGR
jgi:hypothetical protein